MRIVLFYHSLISDWNHGNAHFLRGIMTELLRAGHHVELYEPRDGWSLTNLVARHGKAAVRRFRRRFPQLHSRFYDEDALDLGRALERADLVIVHEWTSPALIGRIGRHRAGHAHFRLLFHDTHHRSVTAPSTMGVHQLHHYDGVLAYGDVIRRIYLERGWAERAWTWHEAADTNVFYPRCERKRGDLVWIGNWGDGERTEELREFLIEPARVLGLRGSAFGVRYPEEARGELERAGLRCSGWVANDRVPELFAAHQVTLHIPRRPYVEQLPGVPTIRPFEAMACGIPLICSAWEDAERLFRPGTDYLVAHNGTEMRRHLRNVLGDGDLAESLARHGLETIRSRHTCAHRVEELMRICHSLGLNTRPERAGRRTRPATIENAARSEAIHGAERSEQCI